MTPQQILETACLEAKQKELTELLAQLSLDCVQELKIIVQHAESLKGVLGVTLTSIVYKIYNPGQDIRYHQEQLPNGYSGRGFDTKYITPFLQDKFPHFAMAESAWLTRSLEQPHPYTFDYPGKISQKVKPAFLGILNRLETESGIAVRLLAVLFALMLEVSSENENLLTDEDISDDLTIAKVVEAVSHHMYGRYTVRGAARIPVLVMYSIYKMLVSDISRYNDKKLALLESHTSPDARSKSLGDIEILGSDGSCFEAVEIKHLKPVTSGMIQTVYRKIKDKAIDRYYILTTSEPNTKDPIAVNAEIAKMRKRHPCQIIVNGVIPSLKYYLRLVSHPENFVDIYTECLENEFERSSGIKSEHLKTWNNIRQTLL
jgi:DNA (cytosine-5)-methyltransferase 1